MPQEGIMIKSIKLFLITLIIVAPLTITPSKALIPFTQAKGMLSNTKEDYKKYSPFWAMVAVHGKMLENIRFFGNYITITQKERDENGIEQSHDVDQGQDAIAILIKRLFNSPDGVQFVATTYEADPVGNLSRHLEAIDPIIRILLSSSAPADKISEIKNILDKIVDIKMDDSHNINPENYPATIRKLLITQLSSKQPIKRMVSETKGGKTILREIQIDPQEELVKNEIENMKKNAFDNEVYKLSQNDDANLAEKAREYGIPIPSVMPTVAKNALIKMIMGRIGGGKAIYSGKSLEELRDIAQKNAIHFDFREDEWKQTWRNELIKKIKIKLTVDKKFSALITVEALKEFALEQKLSFDNMKSPAELIDLFAAELRKRGAQELESHLSTQGTEDVPSSYQAVLKEQVDRDNQIFADLLVKAFEEQKKWANPQNPKNYLYPENIVITALLAYFVQVADDQEALHMLPTLMKEGWKKEPEFTLKDYLDIKEKDEFNKTSHYPNHIKSSEIIKNNETAFLMAKGFNLYQNPFVERIGYRSDTKYEGNPYADCGETSLLNVFGMFLSAHNAGKITPESLEIFRQKIEVSEGQSLKNDHSFIKMMAFFNENNDLSKWSSADVHSKWANIVSNLNDTSKPFTINSIQYGWEIHDSGPLVYEIKSDRHPEVRGIVNMLNVITHLIPDRILNEPWDQDSIIRVEQVALKLDRLCYLLSRDSLELSWINADTGDKTITYEFPQIIFENNGMPVFRWYFLMGHFQLESEMYSGNDWRTQYQTIDDSYFQNEWMASLFSKLTKDQWTEKENIGDTFPLSLIYNRSLRSVDGAINAISFVLHRVIMNQKMFAFLPLIPRWIEKSIFLNDANSLNKISAVVYAVNDRNIPIIQKILGAPRFIPIQKEVLKLEGLSKEGSINPLQMILKLGLSQLLNLMNPERLERFSTLSFDRYTGLSNTDLKRLSGIKTLNPSNSNIKNEDLKNFPHLTSLIAGTDDKITDRGLKYVPHLLALDLSYNSTITDKGLKYVPHLTHLSLNNNQNITGEGLKILNDLVSLDLTYNFIIMPDDLKNLPKLTSLHLPNNYIITDEALKDLPQLTDLDLSLNETITDEGLKNLPRLTRLNLSDNYNITDAAIAELKQRIPNIQIIGK